MAASHTTAVAAWHAYTVDYNTYKLVEYANIWTPTHIAAIEACTIATMRSTQALPQCFSRTARALDVSKQPFTLSRPSHKLRKGQLL